jgi:hypothetical protein
MANDEALKNDAREAVSIQLAVSALPFIGKLQKTLITMLPDISGSLPVFAVLISVFAIKSLNYRAGRIIWAVGACFQLFIAKTAVFYSAAGFGDIPFSAVIPQLTTFTRALCKPGHAGVAVGPAAPDFPY